MSQARPFDWRTNVFAARADDGARRPSWTEGTGYPPWQDRKGRGRSEPARHPTLFNSEGGTPDQAGPHQIMGAVVFEVP
jgi:hypothetical protein